MKEKIIEGIGLFILSMLATIFFIVMSYVTGQDFNEPLALLTCCDIVFGIGTLALIIHNK